MHSRSLSSARSVCGLQLKKRCRVVVEVFSHCGLAHWQFQGLRYGDVDVAERIGRTIDKLIRKQIQILLVELPSGPEHVAVWADENIGVLQRKAQRVQNTGVAAVREDDLQFRKLYLYCVKERHV